MVRPLEDYQLIGRECKHRNMFSGPVLMAEDLTTSSRTLNSKLKPRHKKKLLLEEIVENALCSLEGVNGFSEGVD